MESTKKFLTFLKDPNGSLGNFKKINCIIFIQWCWIYMSYLVNNPNKFCAVAFAVCWFRFLFSQAYWKSRSIIFNMWVLTQQRQSSESRRIFCSVYSVCVSWIKQKAWLYPIPSRSNLDRAQVAYFITSLQHQFLVSLRGNLAAGSVSQDAGFFCGFVALSM